MLDPGIVVTNDPTVERGQRVVLAGESRLALTSAKPVAPSLKCQQPSGNADEAQPCLASIPRNAPAVPHVFVVARQKAKGEPDPARNEAAPAKDAAPAAGADGATTAATAPAPGDVAQPAPVVDGTRGRTASTPVVLEHGPPRDVGALSRFDVLVARLLPAAPLTRRTVTSEPVTLPPGAILRLSHGIEEAAWSFDSAPVYFRVIVEHENGETQDLLRRVLDPARRPSDRRWFDNDVDLSDLAGHTVRLRFSTEPAQEGDTRPSLPVWGDPRVLAPSARRRPSIVLVSLDTLRARSMSAYGYELETTPFLSELATRGALFEKAFTTFSNTLPSHMSMLTGLYPARHAVHSILDALGAEHGTLAEALRSGGYVTAAFTEDALLDARRGFWRGFSTYFEDTSIRDGAGAAESTFGRGLEWIGRHADEPFFVFLHTYQVHMPYKPPVEYQGFFTGPDAPERDHLQQAYEQEIRYTDDLMKRLVEGLARVVPPEELVLVVTADHGEEFREHGVGTHHQLYEEVMHVPLIMVAPGRIPAGRRVATPVSLVDIAPTVLALADVPPPAPLDGLSLLPLLDGSGAGFDRQVVFGEFPRSGWVREPHYVARGADTKCMLSQSGQSDVCFDLRDDPNELRPRPPQDTIEFSKVHALGDAYRRRSIAAQQAVEDARARKRAAAQAVAARRAHVVEPVSAPPADEAAPADAAAADAQAAPEAATATDDAAPAPSDDIENKMRALGYIE